MRDALRDLSRIAVFDHPTAGALANLIFSVRMPLSYASRLSVKFALQRNELPSQLMLTGIERGAYVGQGGCGSVFRGEWEGRTVALYAFYPPRRVDGDQGGDGAIRSAV